MSDKHAEIFHLQYECETLVEIQETLLVRSSSKSLANLVFTLGMFSSIIDDILPATLCYSNNSTYVGGKCGKPCSLIVLILDTSFVVTRQFPFLSHIMYEMHLTILEINSALGNFNRGRGCQTIRIVKLK